MVARDTTPTSTVITWREPSFDGGSPITGYTVEMKEPYSTRWTPANKEPIEETTFLVKRLKENENYQFRVVAHNLAGPGKPSQSVNVTAKYPFGKTSSFHLPVT